MNCIRISGTGIIYAETIVVCGIDYFGTTQAQTAAITNWNGSEDDDLLGNSDYSIRQNGKLIHS